MLILLSYPLSRSSPLYPGIPPVTFDKTRSIARGDPANQSRITVSAHAGTHIDAPLHFCPDGKNVAEMLACGAKFAPAYCIEIKKDPGDCITVEDIENCTTECADAAALLTRTGAFAYRDHDPAKYITDHPWVHENVPAYLRKHFPSLRLFGLDAISLNHPSHREAGRACHRGFLCGAQPILVLEDTDLSDSSLPGRPFSLFLYPWLVDDLDGVPVCVFAEYAD
jgi:kynurenine formamidase